MGLDPMSRRLVASVIGGAAVFGVSVGIAAGLVAVGIARRFGHAPHPPRPGGLRLAPLPFESPEVFGARVGDAVRRRAEGDQ
jgi:hypothetical protein